MVIENEIQEIRKPGYIIDFDITLDVENRKISWEEKTITVEGQEHTVPAGSIELQDGKAFTVLYKLQKGIYVVSPLDKNALMDEDALIIAHIAWGKGKEPLMCECVYVYTDIFRIGDYAVIVSGMFEGTEGTIYYVDMDEKNITLSAGVTVGFNRAFNVTVNPKYRRHSIFTKAKRRFRHKRFVKPEDVYLKPFQREFLRIFRGLCYVLSRFIKRRP